MIDYGRVPRVLTVEAAAQLGISQSELRTELRRGRWQRLARGVLATHRHPPERADWALTALAVAGRGAALTGWDALHAVGLAGGDPAHAPVLVLASHGHCRDVGGAHIRRVAGPIPSRLLSVHHAELPLARIAAESRAVIDTALELHSPLRVRALITRSVQRHACTVEELIAELARARRRDSALARRALGDLLDGARSVAEARAVDRLRLSPVPPFELNVPILDARGRVIAVADVLWRELRAVLEIDSREFHFTVDAWQATMRRHNRLTRTNLALTHYPPSAIDAGDAWLTELAVGFATVPESSGCLITSTVEFSARQRANRSRTGLPPSHPALLMSHPSPDDLRVTVPQRTQP